MTSPKRRGLGDTDPLARPRRTPSPIPSSIKPEDEPSGSDAAVDQAAASAPPARATPPAARASSGSAGKTKVSVYIDDRVLSDSKDAFMASMAATGMTTLSAYVEHALLEQNSRLAREHNGGNAFPARTAQPRAGKPIS